MEMPDLLTVALGSLAAYLIGKSAVECAALDELVGEGEESTKKKRERWSNAGRHRLQQFQPLGSGLLDNGMTERSGKDMIVRPSGHRHLGMPVYYVETDGTGQRVQVYSPAIIQDLC